MAVKILKQSVKRIFFLHLFIFGAKNLKKFEYENKLKKKQQKNKKNVEKKLITFFKKMLK